MLRKATKKSSFLVTRPLRGGGGKGRATKIKKNFFETFDLCVPNIK